jgi:hypothetical protein
MEAIKHFSEIKCSFCGNINKPEEKNLIAGPGFIYVCLDCIDLLHDIAEQRREVDDNNMDIVKEKKEEKIDMDKIWAKTLELLEEKLGKPTFETCLKKSYVNSFENNICTIAVVSRFAKDWLEEREIKN